MKSAPTDGIREIRALKDEISGLQSRLAELRQDLKQLVRWLELVDKDVQRHFRSWSWRIGHTAVGLAKKLMRSDHPPASAYRLSRVLESFRKWKANREEYTTPGRAVATRVDTGFTVLAGTLDQDRAILCKALAEGQSVQVIAFSGSGTDRLNELAGKVTTTSEFEVEDFPEFHRTLSSALSRIGGKRLVILDNGLLGLGLGLLANYHSGTPLVVVDPEHTNLDTEMADPDDDRLNDPRNSVWTRLLQDLAGDLPGTDDPLTWIGEDSPDQGILPAAREFAEWFARFHQRHGTRP